MTTANPFHYTKPPLQRLLDWKVRGIRWVNIIGVALIAVMVVSVYVTKAAAARESARIAELERDIRANNERVRLLTAQVAQLEQPARLEALSRQAGLAPTKVTRETSVEGLTELKASADSARPKPAAPAAPALTAAETQDGEGAQ